MSAKFFYMIALAALLSTVGVEVFAQKQEKKSSTEDKSNKRLVIKEKQEVISEKRVKIAKLKTAINSAKNGMGYGSMASDEEMFRQSLAKLEAQKQEGTISDDVYNRRKNRFNLLMIEMEKNKKERKAEMDKMNAKAKRDIDQLEGEILALENEIKALKKN